MLPSRFPRPLRLGLYVLATVILLVLCLLPTQDLPDTGTGDRFEHTAAWFVLTITGYLLAPRRRLAIPAFALAYGALIEVLQGSLVTRDLCFQVLSLFLGGFDSRGDLVHPVVNEAVGGRWVGDGSGSRQDGKIIGLICGDVAGRSRRLPLPLVSRR